MCREEKICRAARDSLVLRAYEDGVTHNRAKAIDLGTKLDLDGFTGVECLLSLLGVGDEWCVWSDIGARRDSAWMRDALDDLLALVDLCDFVFEEFVTLLADLNNLCALGTPSYFQSASSGSGSVTALRT